MTRSDSKSRFFHRLTRWSRTATAVALAGGLALPQAARADTFQVFGIPDLDQRRAGLANNGNMYCVPTATVNSMYYMSNHGLPGLVNGSSSPYDYANATSNISSMGMYMQTDGVKGTGGGFVNGVVNWLDDHSNHMFVIIDYWYGKGAAISTDTMRSWLKFNASPVLVNWGYFSQDPVTLQFKRTGGHEVTLSGIGTDTTGQRHVYNSDPATNENPNDLWAQSPFTIRDDRVTPYWANFQGKLATLPRMQSSSGYTNTFLDGFTVIRPIWLLTNVIDSNTKIRLHMPAKLTATDVASELSLALTSGLADIAMDPAAPSAAYLQTGANGIFHLDLATGESAQVASMDRPTRLVWGGEERNLYVLGGGGITLSSFDADGRPLSTINSRVAFDAMAWDPQHERLVLVSRAAARLYYYDANLRYLGSDVLPTLEGTGRLTLSIDGASGEMWAHADGSLYVTAMGTDTAGTFYSRRVRLQTTASPKGLFVQERGYLFVSEGGYLREYLLDGTASRRTAFAGLPSNGVMTMPRTFSNYDEARIGPRDTLVEAQ